MDAPLEIFGFQTSNNMKVRIALNYKGLDFIFHEIDPRDRATIVEMTGQPLTPVLRHGEVVMFDSGSILRYLDANFPAAPRLFTGDRKTLVEIEDWEVFGRAKLLGPLIRVVNHRLEGGSDGGLFAAAAAGFQAAIVELGDRLEGDWLVGNAMTGADVMTAPVAFRAAAYGFAETDDIPAHVGRWIDRVMAYDSPHP